jgi:hypothetical protein
MSVVSVMIQARRLERIFPVRDLLKIIESKGGLYLSDAVVAEALRLADEI